MQIQYMKAGVVYAHRTRSDGEYTPVILLDTQLRQMRRPTSYTDPVFRLAPPKTKPSLKSSRTYGDRNFVPTGYVAMSIGRYGAHVGPIDDIAPEQYTDSDWRMEELCRFIPLLPTLVEDFTRDPAAMSDLGKLVELSVVLPRNIAGTWGNIIGLYNKRVAETEAKNEGTQAQATETNATIKALVGKVREIIADHPHSVSSQSVKVKDSFNKEFPNWIEHRGSITFEPDALLALLTSLGVEVHS
jgi:hypothetical protein